MSEQYLSALPEQPAKAMTFEEVLLEARKYLSTPMFSHDGTSVILCSLIEEVDRHRLEIEELKKLASTKS